GDLQAKLETPCLKQLYAYWDARRAGRALPARRDIDPLDLRFVLGHVMLIDVLRDPVRFRFRLHGSELAFRAGYDMTGKLVDDLPNAENRAILLGRCRLLLETRQAIAVASERRLDTRVFNYEVIWLPLADDGETINMLLGGAVYGDSHAAGP